MENIFRDWDKNNKYVKSIYQANTAKIGHLEYLYDILKEGSLSDWAEREGGYNIGEVVFDTNGIYRNTVAENSTEPSENSPANGWVLLADITPEPTDVSFTETITLTEAQIETLGSAPFNVSGQFTNTTSAGEYYEIESLTVKNKFNTTPYSMEYLYFYGCFTAMIDSGFIGSNEDILSIVKSSTQELVDVGGGEMVPRSPAFLPNTGLRLTTYDGSNPTGGDGEVEIIVTYKIKSF